MQPYRPTTTWTALAVLAFAAVAAGASCRGDRARVVLPGPARVTVDGAEILFR